MTYARSKSDNDHDDDDDDDDFVVVVLTIMVPLVFPDRGPETDVLCPETALSEYSEYFQKQPKHTCT